MLKGYKDTENKYLVKRLTNFQHFCPSVNSLKNLPAAQKVMLSIDCNDKRDSEMIDMTPRTTNEASFHSFYYERLTH